MWKGEDNLGVDMPFFCLLADFAEEWSKQPDYGCRRVYYGCGRKLA